MFAKVNTAGLLGINGFMAEIEADVQNGLPGLYLTGALSTETKEAQHRIWNALKNSGIHIEPKKITVNFSPAALRKDGTAYDLPIAAAILGALGTVDSEGLRGTGFLGEVGLDGSVKFVRGVLPMCMTLKKYGITRMVVPWSNKAEAMLIEDIEVCGVSSIEEMIEAVRSLKQGRAGAGYFFRSNDGRADCACGTAGDTYDVDFSEVHGQAYLKRAAEIAVSGRHNILFSGPAGTGKTMIARRMPTIMPELTREEDIEISKLYSICGLLPEGRPLLSKRPFRSPHHGISEAAFAGGGAMIMPGEISLASGGILFLDEMPLFQRNVLEMLRQPLEERRITVTRVKGSCTYPADLMLAAAMNNCACGYYPDKKRCTCTRAQIKAYTGRISKPLLERIDICAEARPVSFDELNRDAGNEESSAVIRERVKEVYRIQTERFKDADGIGFNSRMSIREIEKYCRLGNAEHELMEEIFRSKNLSGRTYHKILKVARTIADMDGAEQIREKHLIEAASMRSIEDKLFSGNNPKIN